MREVKGENKQFHRHLKKHTLQLELEGRTAFRMPEVYNTGIFTDCILQKLLYFCHIRRGASTKPIKSGWHSEVCVNRRSRNDEWSLIG